MELDNQQRSSEQENVQRSSLRRGVGRIISSEMVGLHNCVYCLKDSRDLKVRYIGKTVCSLKKRLGEHLQDSRRHNTKVSRWVFNRIDNGYDILMQPLVCGVNLDNWERRYIKRFRLKGFKLLNMTEGGGGVVGHIQTEESRMKKSKALAGKPKSSSHVQKMREAFSREAYIYDITNGKFLKKYASFKEAAKELNVAYSSLCISAKKGNHAKNFKSFYTFQGDYIKVRPRYFKPGTPEKYNYEEDMIQAL